MDAVLLDLDGTLVDSVYQHVVSWHAALQAAGEHGIPQWRIHAGIGMGSDRLLPWLLGRHADAAAAISDDHTRRFLALAEDDLRPTRGALALLDDLETREVPHLVATSAGADEREALLEALGRPALPTTDADDVASSKPAPDLLVAGCAQLDVDPRDVTVVGDAPWDIEAAQRIGARAIGVRTGGFSVAVLRAAGAVDVVDAPGDLVGRL